MTFQSQYTIPVIVFVAGIALISSWMLYITPTLENYLDKFSQLDFYVGKSSTVDVIGDKMPEPTTIYSIYNQQASPVNSTTVKITGSYNIYDAATEKKLWDSNSTNLVDKRTGKFLSPVDTYFQRAEARAERKDRRRRPAEIQMVKRPDDAARQEDYRREQYRTRRRPHL